MNQRITIKDIAQKAEVSIGTVDRVIHDRGNVAPKVKERIIEVMEELGYKRNIMASTLAYNRLFRIAVILPDYKLDPYWKELKKGIDKAIAIVQHYRVVVKSYYFNLFEPSDFLKKCNEMWDDEDAPDAVLFVPQFLKESKVLLEECKKRAIPNVMINTNISNTDSLCYIGQDSYQSGVLGARLLNSGSAEKSTILFLNLAKGSTNAQHLIDKEQGFRDYFEQNKERGIKVIKGVFEEFYDNVKLKAFLKMNLEIYPELTGIFVTTSRAYKVIDCLSDEDAQRIKIVGFDLIEANLKYLKTNKLNFLINQNPVQQGFLGIMNIVKHLILKRKVDPLQHLPLDIVVNENVAYYLNQELHSEILV
jgi:LacI family transcriptional regulator, galactose operon repressor